MLKSFLYKLVNTEVLLLFIGIIVLFFHYVIMEISLDNQMIILLLMVFIIGVPHGALDFLVDEQNKTVLKEKFSIKKFVTVYLFRLFAFSIFWIFPWIAFSLFICFSIYHFGETDISTLMKTKKSSTILYLVYGFFIIGILLITHISEIGESLPVMKPYLTKSSFYHFLSRNYIWVVIVFSAAFLLTAFWQNKIKNLSCSIFKIIQLIVLILIISLLPLLLAFTFYFTLWHSILSVRNIFSYIKAENNSKKLKDFFTKSVLFSLLALGSILLLYVALQYYLPQTNLLFALLIVLSVLTLPHLTVMHNMYKNMGNMYQNKK